MDIDSPAFPSRRASAVKGSPAFGGSGIVWIKLPWLGRLLLRLAHRAGSEPDKKRRSLVSSSPASPSGSPSAKRTSLTRNMERAVSSSGAMLFFWQAFDGRIPSKVFQTTCSASNPITFRNGFQLGADFRSAVMYPNKAPLGSGNPFSRAGTAPMRRAFSVCDQPAMRRCRRMRANSRRLRPSGRQALRPPAFTADGPLLNIRQALTAARAAKPLGPASL